MKAQARPADAAAPSKRASPARLFLLLALGIVLAGAALYLRSSRWVREPILRRKDLPALEALVRSQPEDALARYYLGRSYFINHRFSDARTAYEDATHLDPSLTDARLGLGYALFELGEMPAATDEFKRALQLDDHLARAEFMLGKIAWLEKQSKEALPHIKRAVQLDPRNDQAWYGLGICLVQVESRDAAIPAIQHAIACNAAKPQYHTMLGELYVYFGRAEEARQEYERALQLDPNYGPACALMGQFLVHHDMSDKNARERAEKLLLAATEKQTYRPQDVYRDLGELYIQTGRSKQAVPALEESIRKDPRDERSYYALVRAYQGLGDEKAAAATRERFHFISRSQLLKDSLEVHLKFYPEDAAAHLKLAQTYLDLGMGPEASSQYRVVLSKSPGLRDAAFERRLQQYFRTAPSRPRQDFGFSGLQ